MMNKDDGQAPSSTEFRLSHFVRRKKIRSHNSFAKKLALATNQAATLFSFCCSVVFKCMMRCPPEYLTSKLVRRSAVSIRSTRTSQLLDIPLFRTASVQRTFQCRATSLRNELPPALKLSPSVTALKRLLRQKLLNDYFL